MEFLLFKYIHIMCLVYWLGGDLGTFIASRSLINTKLGAEARVIAAKILVACDQGPRYALPLMFMTGLQMAYLIGVLLVNSYVMVLLWLITLLWIIILITLHLRHGNSPNWMTRVDWVIRLAVCATSIILGFVSIQFETVLNQDWAAYKLFLFGVTVLMGIMIRLKLKPFFSAFANLLVNKVDESTNQIIHQSIGGTIPFVVTIWAALFLTSAIGLHLIP